SCESPENAICQHAARRVTGAHPIRWRPGGRRRTPDGAESAGTVTPMIGDDILSPLRLDGRTAIVPGASSGLGARFARVLHAAGATVVVSARRRDRLDALASELGDRARSVPADVAVADDCARLVETATGINGGLDILVNNAGIEGYL